MSGTQNADVIQADDLMSKAEKKLKKTLFRWNPSYLEAGELYDRAAKLYANAMLRGNACDAWKKAAAAYRKAHENNFAATSLESLASFLISKYSSELVSPEPGETSGTLSEAVMAFQEAAMLSRAERPARSIDLMHRAVDVMERVLNEDSANRVPLVGSTSSLDAVVPPNPLYKEFVKVVYNTLAMYHLFADREEILPHRVPGLCRACVIRHLRCGQYDLAIAIEKHLLGCLVVKSNLNLTDPQCMYEELTTPPNSNSNVYNEDFNVFKRLRQPTNAARTGLEIIILTLYVNKRKVEEANKEFQTLCKVFGFKDSQEQRSVSLLLSAMEDGNESQIEEVLTSDQCFIFILSQISRMAMNFKNPASSSVESAVRGSTTIGVRLSVSSSDTIPNHGVPHTPVHVDPNHLSVPDEPVVTPPPQSYSSPSDAATITPLPSTVMMSLGGIEYSAKTATEEKATSEPIEVGLAPGFQFPFMENNTALGGHAGTDAVATEDAAVQGNAGTRMDDDEDDALNSIL